jgi:AraC-like DNA-binding protein
MAIHVVRYIKNRYKEHLIEAKGVTVARYFSTEDHYKSEAYMEQNLLNIVLKGQKTLHTAKGDIDVQAGEAFFLPRGEYVMSEVCEGGEYACLLIFFNEKVIADWLVPLLESVPLHVRNKAVVKERICKIALSPFIESTALSLLPFIEHKPAFVDQILILKLQELLLLLLGSLEGEKLISFFDALVARNVDLVHFMEQYFVEPWSVEEFAKRSGRSLSAFKNEFAMKFNQPPMKWILDKRLERAAFLIEKGELSIGEAAFRVGFKSPSHFSKLFKEKFSYAPKTLQIQK